MKKIVLAAFVLVVGLPAAAQDTYESARLLGEDLNGTARYVGMGGATTSPPSALILRVSVFSVTLW